MSDKAAAAAAPPATSLPEFQRRFLEFFQAAPRGVAQLDTKGRIRVANAVLERLAGAGAGGLTGRSVASLLAESSGAGWAQALAQARSRAGLAAPLLAMPAQPAPEDARWELHCRVVRSEDQPASLLLDVADVTERHRAERRLAMAVRLETVGRLAGGIAHDFNNLLTAILGSTVMARDHGLPAAALAELSTIEDAAQRGATLVRHLLTFAGQQPVQPRPVALGDAVTAVMPLLRRLLGQDVQLEVRTERPGPLAYLDPGQLDQVVLNLAVNARDAMPDGGVLSISTLQVAHAVGGSAPLTRYASLKVADTGRGIAPEVLPRIWDPFFTTCSERGGTGLGLTTVRDILDRAGGQAFVETQLGQGTTFHVLLPLHEPEAPAATAPPQAEPILEPGATVLLVEDEPELRQFTAYVLRKAGLQVRTAESAEAALAECEGGAAPSLLVSDVEMPGQDGLALARSLRLRWPDLPVLLLSGYAAPTFGCDLEAEGLRLLAKPFTPETLIQTVAACLAARRDEPGGTEA